MTQPFNGHAIINHINKQIIISKRTLDELKRRNLLDTITQPPRFKSQFHKLFNEIEKLGHADFYRELGEDMSGPNVPRCTCKECVDRAVDDLAQRYSRVFDVDDVNALIGQIKKARRMKVAC
jgi:glutamyl/glutaminyl-tRNA synthetase